MDKFRNHEGSAGLLFKNAGNFSQYKRLLRSNWEINSITSSYTYTHCSVCFMPSECFLLRSAIFLSHVLAIFS